MRQYVVGLIFGETGMLLLQKKDYADNWNGIAGKIKKAEIPPEAMVRECQEGIGLSTYIEDWEYVVYLGGDDVQIHFFKLPIDGFRYAKQMEGEELRWVHLEEIPGIDVVPHLRWIIAAALDKSISKPILGQLA